MSKDKFTWRCLIQDLLKEPKTMQFWIMDALKQSVVRYTHRNINEDKKNVVVRYRSLIQLYVNNFGLYVNNGCTKKICG